MNNQAKKNTPLNCDIKTPLDTPGGDYVISENDQGVVVSRFKDDVWDFYPYGPIKNSKRVHFENIPAAYRDEIKSIAYNLYFKIENGIGGFIEISTLHSHIQPLRKIAFFCEKSSISISDFFNSADKLILFLEGIDTKGSAVQFNSLVSILRSYKSKKLPYSVYKGIDISCIRQRIKELDYENRQHPIIPQRVLSELISQIQELVVEASAYKNKIIRLLKKMSKDPGYGLSRATQIEDYGIDVTKPFFGDAIKTFNLVNFCKDRGISNKTNLYEYINNVRFLCRWLIEAYSGMRKGEVYSLTSSSLDSVQIDLEEYWLFSGTTTKLVPGQKLTTWVTSKDIINAYDFLKSFSLMIGSHIGLKKSEIPLFISSDHMARTKAVFDGKVILMGSSNNNPKIPNEEKMIIDKNDLDFLYRVNPFIDWSNDDKFQIGKVWSFTDHQFRRSIAFYAAQSNMVTLPSLKRQYQHCTFAMTIYYSSAKNSYLSSDSKHIAYLLSSISLDAEIYGYIENILLSKDELHGPKGQFIEKKELKVTDDPRILQTTWIETKKLAKKGMFSCKPTLFGYCTSTSNCDDSLTMDIPACIDCKNAITTIPKLKKAIDSYELVVNSEPNTSEGEFNKRFGFEILDKLKNYKNKIEKRKKI